MNGSPWLRVWRQNEGSWVPTASNLHSHAASGSGVIAPEGRWGLGGKTKLLEAQRRVQLTGQVTFS